MADIDEAQRRGVQSRPACTESGDSILLTPLWSRHLPPNNSRVIDCPPDVELTDTELTVYFAVALYIRVSLHGRQSSNG